jgi:hypothetical protein
LVDVMTRNVFFPRFEYYMFYVIYPFVTHELTFPRNKEFYTNSQAVCYEPDGRRIESR